MEIKEFIREVYLTATPSIDIEATNETIDCCNHKIKMSDYERILAEFSEGITDRVMWGNMWMLCSGPQLVED